MFMITFSEHTQVNSINTDLRSSSLFKGLKLNYVPSDQNETSYTTLLS